MEFLKVLLLIVEVICCFLLVGVILLQRSKSEGMGGLAAGSGMGEQLFGSRTGNVLTRTTIILACVFMGTTTLLAVVYTNHGDSKSIIEQQMPGATPGRAPAAAPAAAPAPTPAAAPAAAAPTAPAVPLAPVQLPPAGAPAAPASAPAAAPASP